MPLPDPPEKDVTGLANYHRAGSAQFNLAEFNLDSLFALSPDAILLTDIDGVICDSNPQTAELFGYDQAELIGMRIEALLPERFRDRLHGYRENLNADPCARPMGAAMNLFCLRKDGTECPVDILFRTMQTSSGPIVLSFVRDTSEQKAAQEAMRQQAAETAMLQMSGALLAKLDARELLGVVSGSIRGLIPHDAATLALFDAATGMLRVQILGSEGIDAPRSELRLPVTGTPAGEAFRTRQPFLLERMEGSPGPTEDPSERTKFERQVLEDEMNTDHRFEDIVGESSGLRNVLSDVAIVAPTDATVLIQGETGTGKELLARAIHRLSLRSERPFIKLNCAAIPPGLLESELFGHEKGAFTGAIARKLGRLELAQNGTLFLDEIGELPLDLQPKVLRALQEREIERLGGTRPIKVNVRLIAATNRDLARMVAEKQFRADLFYRLKVFPIFAPSLRDRVSDIPALVRHFVSIHSRHMGKTITIIPGATMDALMRWKWAGNIRELENFLERAVILTHGSVLYVPLAELEAVELETAEPHTKDEDRDARTRFTTHAAAERQHIVNAMRETRGHISGKNGAAARLGLRRTTLNSKLKKLAIAKIDYM
jgi:PAS domain S-box-containing protein